MAIAAVYTSENCPGIPKGAVVKINTAHVLPDQKAAWENARRVHDDITWRHRIAEHEAQTQQDTAL